MIALAWLAFVCAAVPALLYLWNSFLFREPPEIGERPGSSRPSSSTAGINPAAREPISVLIPARNEERGIAACVESVLSSRHVELEVIVLDDHSTDRTAQIVREIAAKDARLRLETAPPLPDGWCGKQAACHALSRLAMYDRFTFLDADVRLEPDALARMALFQEQSGAALVSGFPHQETVTFHEKLLIPLIHWLLLSFLPLWAMRRFRWSAFGAGCGQWFLTTRDSYERVGGHAAIKSSLHDGLTLPRAYRRAGFMTDLCDATHLATCRMYHSNRAVWFGLAKNAREGMAAAEQIWFWSMVLFFGQVLPMTLSIVATYLNEFEVARVAFAACVVTMLIRWSLARRTRGKDPNGPFLHQLGILFLLMIQWYAILRAVFGKPIGWKGRSHPHLPGDPQSLGGQGGGFATPR